jgi:hypothetical protein
MDLRRLVVPRVLAPEQIPSDIAGLVLLYVLVPVTLVQPLREQIPIQRGPAALADPVRAFSRCRSLLFS